MRYIEIGLRCSKDTILVAIAQHNWGSMESVTRKRIFYFDFGWDDSLKVLKTSDRIVVTIMLFYKVTFIVCKKNHDGMGHGKQ